MRDCRVMIATVVWQDGTRRTIATTNPADLVTLGVVAKGNQTPEQFDAAFKDKLVDEPRGQQNVLRIAVQRSGN